MVKHLIMSTATKKESGYLKTLIYSNNINILWINNYLNCIGLYVTYFVIRISVKWMFMWISYYIFLNIQNHLNQEPAMRGSGRPKDVFISKCQSDEGKNVQFTNFQCRRISFLSPKETHHFIVPFYTSLDQILPNLFFQKIKITISGISKGRRF